MDKIIILTKIFTKNSIQSLTESKKNANKKQKLSTMLVYIIALVYLAVVIGGLSYSLVENLKELGQEKMFIGIVFLIIGVITLIQTIFSAMSLMYYSKDNEYILPLPIKPKQIVIAKTNTIMISEYAFVAIARSNTFNNIWNCKPIRSVILCSNNYNNISISSNSDNCIQFTCFTNNEFFKSSKKQK